MLTSDRQRAWAGKHIPVRAQFVYGSIRGTSTPEIESTVELNDKEVELIQTRIRDFGARMAIVRPAEREPGYLDVEFRSARPFERIRRVPDPEEEIDLHIREETTR